MNEWIHISLSALGGIGVLVVGAMSNSIRAAQKNLREDLRRIEDKADENAQAIARIEGLLRIK